MAKIIALDLGERRIGVAISDALGMLAHPLTTLKWKGIKTLVRNLKEIIEDQEIVTVVIGIPYTLKGGHSKKTDDVLKICDQLENMLDVNIRQIDERLTTKMAHDSLHAVGKKPAKQKDIIDQIAATFILQAYLDKS